MADEARDPSEQFQIFDDVLYVKEGVVTKIAGYRWYEPVGGLPTIMAYALACGVEVPKDAITRIEFERPTLGARGPGKRFKL